MFDSNVTTVCGARLTQIYVQVKDFSWEIKIEIKNSPEINFVANISE